MADEAAGQAMTPTATQQGMASDVCALGSSGRRQAPARRTPPSTSSSARVSPYPLRERTPPHSTQTLAPRAHQRARVSLSTPPDNAEQHRLQLVVQGVVKDTVGMRDSSGKMQEVFAANGATFGDIMHKLWMKFSCHIKGQAVKEGDTWSLAETTELAWNKVMQFKVNGRIVSTAKSEEAWNRWIASLHGETATLMIYTYGLCISNARVLDEFKVACIRPEHTDRSGAAAEASIHEVVERLREIWGATFQASAVGWRMWANDIMRNRDRSTWELALLNPPSARIEPMLRAADVQVEQHLADLTQSADMALDSVNASIADTELLHHHWEMFGMRIENQKNALIARKQALEGIRAAIPLPPLSDVIDPLPTMANMDDTEHRE